MYIFWSLPVPAFDLRRSLMRWALLYVVQDSISRPWMLHYYWPILSSLKRSFTGTDCLLSQGQQFGVYLTRYQTWHSDLLKIKPRTTYMRNRTSQRAINISTLWSIRSFPANHRCSTVGIDIIIESGMKHFVHIHNASCKWFLELWEKKRGQWIQRLVTNFMIEESSPCES